MTTMTAESLTQKPKQLREAVKNGDQVLLTFHGKPYARVIPHDEAEEQRAELERLRAEVQALRDRLEGAPAA